MNNRHKFRAWDLEAKEYLPKDIDINMGMVTFWSMVLEEPDIFVVEQCTGLKDRDGALIFEGDIVRFKMENASVFNGPTRGVITWDQDNRLRYVIKNGSFETGINGYLEAYRNCCEIIGNIHETPELLEAK